MKLIKNPKYELYEKGNQIYCDSLQVAETFKRKHKHILDTIEKLTEPTSGLSERFRQLNFEESTYKDTFGKKNKKKEGSGMMPEWLIKFVKWIEEHPYKTMFFIQIPLSIIVSLLTIKLLG